jgi:hypothetical protein
VEINIKIGDFCSAIQEFKQVSLHNNQEIDVSDLNCLIPTPEGQTRINYIIKKENLEGLKLILDNSIEIKCAKKHILLQNNQDIYAEDINVGDQIDSKTGARTVTSIEPISDSTYYDIGIDYPHLYYDSDGILHHNTIMTAVMSASVQNYGRSIVIVPNKSLVTQTESDYINVGLDVGVYFGDRKDYNKQHTICTWQSLNNLLKDTKNGEAVCTIDEFIEGVVCVIIDEAHMAKADSLKLLLSSVFSKVPLRWGLTGTIPKEEYAFMALKCCIGEVVGRLSASELQEAGHLAQCHVNILQLTDFTEYKTYQQELKYLLENKERLTYIAKTVEKIRQSGNTLVLVDRVAAGKELTGQLTDAVFVSGTTKAASRKEEYDQVATSEKKIIVATYGVAAVGINIPRIFNLVLLEPGKSFVRVIQSIGRGIRKAEDKDHVEIWDITSTCKFSKRHLTKRKAFYKDANYPFSVDKVEWQ